MNIVFCLNHFMPQQVAGTEVYTWALAKALQARGHAITIVVPNYDKTNDDEYLYDGLSVKRYAEPNLIDSKLRKGNRPPDGIASFVRLIESIVPDVVHIQGFAGSSGIGIYHVRALKELNIRLFFTFHLVGNSCKAGTLMYKGSQPCNGIINISKCTKCTLHKTTFSPLFDNLLYGISLPLAALNVDLSGIDHSFATGLSFSLAIKKFRNRLFEIADSCEKLIVLTDWYKNLLLKNGIPEGKLQFIRQALPYLVTKMEHHKPKSNALQLVYVGRIDPQKGLHLLLEAISSLPALPIVLDIYGATNDQAYFDFWYNKTQGNKNVRWKGVLQQNAIVNVIADYDALVLPSAVAEMSPLVIQEAYAARVPVIGANVAGIAEQITDGFNGLLFDFNSSSSLSSKLKSIIDNSDLLDAIRSNLPNPQSFEKVVDENLRCYTSNTKQKIDVSTTGK